jgi:hypothetical protein
MVALPLICNPLARWLNMKENTMFDLFKRNKMPKNVVPFPTPKSVAPVEPPQLSTPVAEEKTISPTPVLAAASSTVTTDCPPAESAPTTYKSDAPKKAGDMVYLQSKNAQLVCVIDVLGKVQNKQLEPGVGVSVYGKAPFKVLTAGLDQVDLYYQGSKVRPSNPTGKTIVLESAEFNQPLTPTDSQLR